jgi:hypothetical protein
MHEAALHEHPFCLFCRGLLQGLLGEWACTGRFSAGVQHWALFGAGED